LYCCGRQDQLSSTCWNSNFNWIRCVVLVSSSNLDLFRLINLHSSMWQLIIAGKAQAAKSFRHFWNKWEMAFPDIVWTQWHVFCRGAQKWNWRTQKKCTTLCWVPRGSEVGVHVQSGSIILRAHFKPYCVHCTDNVSIQTRTDTEPKHRECGSQERQTWLPCGLSNKLGIMRKLKTVAYFYAPPQAIGIRTPEMPQFHPLSDPLSPERTTLITAKVFTTLESVSAAERHFAVELSALELCSRAGQEL